MNDSDAEFVVGLTLQRGNSLDEAALAYRRALCSYPVHGDAWHNLAVIIFCKLDYVESINAFEKACRSDAYAIDKCLSHVHAVASYGDVNLAMSVMRSYREGGLFASDIVSQLELRFESTLAAAAIDRASNLFVSGNYSALLDLARRSISCFPENGFFWRAIGLASFKLGALSEAIESFTIALRLWVNDAESWLNRSAVFLDIGLIDKARFDAERAVSLSPESELAINNLVVATESLGAGEQVVRYCEIACALNPYSVDALRRLANARQSQLHASKAQHLLYKALCIEPENSEVLTSIFLLAQRARLSATAFVMVKRAIASWFLNAKALGFLAAMMCDAAHSEAGRLEALVLFRFAMAINPADAEVINNYGVLLLRSDRRDDALRVLMRSRRLIDDYADPFCNLGMVHQAVGAIDSATLCYQHALVLRPDYCDAINNLGSVRWHREESALAMTSFDRALSVFPDSVNARHNRCKALHGMLFLDEAIKEYSSLLCRSPELFEVYWHQSLAYLAKGNFESGWRLYEYRWLLDQSRVIGVRGPIETMWVGGTIPADKRLLVYHEQGLGDTLQFCRYVRLLVARGVSVVTRVPDSLLRLLRGQGDYGTVVGFSDPVPPFDLHCPMMSLPLAVKTTLESIPYSDTAYLRELSSDGDGWGARLDDFFRVPDRGSRGLRVGLVWNGGFRPEQPALWEANQRRNISLSLFAKHLDIPNIDFVCLQKGDPAESELRGRETEYWRRGRILNVADSLSDFADTAGVISNLDLVISVDTSTAHLSAAMGKPTWILNRHDTCWRWLINRSDSPWYKSVTLYRQGPERDWAVVLNRVAADLAKLVGKHR